MATFTRQPTRLVTVPCGNKKGKKRKGDEPKEEVLEESEIATWFLTEMDQITQTDPARIFHARKRVCGRARRSPTKS